MRLNARLVLALAILFAGCVGNPAHNAEPSTSISQTSEPVQTTTTTQTPPVEAPPLDYFAGLECFEGSGGSFGVEGTYGETAPPGWEGGGIPVTRVFVRILSCERIGWGPLERPAHVLFEYHQSFTPPESCREDGTGNFFFASIWFDDAALVAQAAQLGMPAILGNFSREETSNQGVNVWTWTWSVPGGEPSTLTISDNPPTVPVTFSTPDRIFWFTENQANYFDATFVRDANQVGNPTAVGSMSEPMLYAKGGVSEFFGTAAVSQHSSFDGTIHRFSDLECKNELPPP